MPNTLLDSLNAFTPKLTALDPRGMAVRIADYHRARNDAPPELRFTRQKYDELGRLSGSMDPRLGRLAESDPAVPDNLFNRFSLSATTLFTDSVDAGWRLTLFTETGESRCTWDGRGHFRQQEHDGLNRLVTVIETMPDQPPTVVERLSYGSCDAESASHNQCGRLIRHDDTVGSEVISEYGMSGSPIVQARRFTKFLAFPDWPLDQDLRETLLEQQPATTRWELSALGETFRQIDSRQNVQRNVYDLAGNLKCAFLQMSGAAENAVVQSIGYNVDNRIEREVAGNGLVIKAEYDECDGRLIHLHCSVNAQRPLQSLRYVYDPVGNLVVIDDAAAASAYFRNQRVEHRCTYGYDSLYQLIWSTGFEAINAPNPFSASFSSMRDPAQVANYREDYEYDEAGNFCTLVHVGGNQYTRHMATAKHSNRSLAAYDDVVPGEPEIAAGFDPNGNSRELLRGQVLEWDGRNQLQRVTPVFRPEGEDDCEVYGYDSKGQRRRKSATRLSKFASVIQEVRYLPGIELHTDSNTGRSYQVIRVEAGLSRISVVHWESPPPSGMASEYLSYSLTDHLRSGSIELSKDADVLSQEYYLPYGGTAWWADNGSSEASYKTIRYAGKERDASGLYYYGLRYYAPWLQRWINPDPAGNVDGLNFYQFVRSNPVTLNDSDGLSAKPFILLFGFEMAYRRVVYNFAQDSKRESFTGIREINLAIGISWKNVNVNYLTVMENIRKGIVADDDILEPFLRKKSHFYRGTVKEAKEMLQSWADYLKENVSSLDIMRKFKKYDGPNGKPSDEFWKKNAFQDMSEADVGTMTKLLRTDPEKFFSSTGGSPAAKNAVTQWFFRQTSKMAMDWLAQTQESGRLLFLEVELYDPEDSRSGWRTLRPAAFEAKPYKDATAKIGSSYNSIAFSERRQLQKEMANPESMLAKKSKIDRSLITLARLNK
jgi:insecticidal toxin complex protein TccC